MAIIYFLQSDVVSTLLDAGVEVVVLTDDERLENKNAPLRMRFSGEGGIRIPSPQWGRATGKQKRTLTNAF